MRLKKSNKPKTRREPARRTTSTRRRRDRKRVSLKTQAQLDLMREAGRLVQRVHQRCRELARPGVTTRQIDEAAGQMIADAGAEGLFKGYVLDPKIRPFPSHLCISVNEVVVHGIADERELAQGDIVGVDCGVRLNGWCGDAATTIAVGPVTPEVQRLLDVTQQCLGIALAETRPGRLWSDVARLMEAHAKDAGYGVVENFVGHGIGQELHEHPQVPNFVSDGLLKHDINLKPGLVLAIEPMCNMGTKDVEVLADGWTVVTKDRKPSAHFEHTVAVTETGCMALTDEA